MELIVQQAYHNPFVVPVLHHEFGEGPLFSQRYTIVEIECIVAALYNKLPLLSTPPSPHVSPHNSPEPSLNRSHRSLDTSSDYSVDHVKTEGQGEGSSQSSEPTPL